MLLLAVLSLCCCAGFSLAAASGGYSGCGARVLIVVVALVAEHRLWGMWASVFVAPGLWKTGLIVVVHGFSCSAARGIFPNQRANSCLLHWQVDFFFLLLSHQGSPLNFLKLIILENKIFKLYYAKSSHCKSRENR